MEYGYEITDTAGNKRFFVEGCIYCSMSTGGLHEQHCPLSKHRRITELDNDRFMDENLKAFYRKKGLL